ncbi:MAG TPA: sugar transferase [Patescibacteria group bacterium]|nr:sugar transferase [Patescibacteria group bacterium]
MEFASLPRYKYVLAIGDYCCMILSCLIALQFRPLTSAVDNSADMLMGILTFALIGMGWGVIMQYHNLYKAQVITTKSRQIVLLLQSMVYAVIAFSIVSFFIRPSYWIDSRLAVILLFGGALLLLIVWRLIIFNLLWSVEVLKEKYKRRTAIIGTGEKAQRIASQIIYGLNHDLQVVGVISDIRPVETNIIENYYTIGTTTDLLSVSSKYHLDSFLIATDTIEAEELIDIAEKCTLLGKQVDVASDIYNIVLEKWNVEEYTGVPVVRFVGARNNRITILLKRFFDIVLTTLALLLLLPFITLISMLVLFTSKGPLIYKQKRIGKGGKEFNFYKFRSMTVAGEDDDAVSRKELYSQFMNGKEPEKIINIRRVTKIGKFLRKTSLDELPQLWNVLKGDMSLVGPRPPVPYEYEMYSEWQKKRLAATPGCTGLWQISDRINISFTDMVLLDFYYIENISIWLDLQILLKTIPVMLFGRGGK